MRHGDLKRALLSVLVVGGLAWLTVPRTYAVFNGETRNVASSLSTGTLLEGNAANGGADCDSNAGASNNKNTTCTTLMTYSSANEYYPGGPAATATVTIKAKGTLDATDLRLDMPACTVSATSDAPLAQQGTGNPCLLTGATTLTVQETTPGNVRCLYPNTGTTCVPDASTDLNNFFTTYTDSNASLSLGSGPVAGASRSFTIGLAFPATAPSSVQGTTVNFTLEWVMKNGS